MVSFEEHCRISELRTGKRYEDLHKWIDEFHKELGVNHREKRHGLNDIEEVRKKWSDDGIIEFLVHIIVDFQDTKRKLEYLFHKIKEQKDELDGDNVLLKEQFNELLKEAHNLELAAGTGVPWGLSKPYKPK